MKIEKLFESNAKKHGTIIWDEVELAITQDPYPFGPVEDWFFTATAMDKDGNRWDIIWQPKHDADEYDDYSHWLRTGISLIRQKWSTKAIIWTKVRC